MTVRKYLTKSNFKIGLECPRKLFYLKKPDEYFNKKESDPFLEALAKGGYQVGALAKLKYKNGVEIFSKKHEDALAETSKLLAIQNVCLFEAAFNFEHLFVRSDIVVKSGNILKLIEVKSKSFDATDFEKEYLNATAAKSGHIALKSDWVEYLYDLAFQTYVARKNYPNLTVIPYLMALDRNTAAKEDNIHQLFLVKSNGNNIEIIQTRQVDDTFVGHNLLREVDLTEIVNTIIQGAESSEKFITGTMDVIAKRLSDIYLKNEKVSVASIIGSQCKKCEYRGNELNLKSGFDECWVERANIEAASSKKLVIDLWNFRGTDKAIQNNIFELKHLTEDDLGKGAALKARQLIQIEKESSGDLSPWFDKAGLREAMGEWTYPLHFIDFETCMPAIPFKKGFYPYSEIAFQFSHHTMDEKGNIRHFGEFINLSPGHFPTFDFCRELKRQLESDEGTIFRYSAHENSVLNRAIFLLERSDVADRDALISFFKTITKKKDKDEKTILWEGDRNMIDLCDLVKKYYYSPLTGGSNSLKFVLPSILKESSFLQKKYSMGIYGSEVLQSNNFKEQIWVLKTKDGYSSDPYKALPQLFSQVDLAKIENLISEEDAIRNGGAAMMAYCKSQYTQMSEIEREALRKSLLKYCELDTLAMVMLVEYWKDVITQK
jgi:hypothetical protein